MANGDKDDDKEVEDENDPRDVIADDNGFVKQFKTDPKHVKEWNRGGVKKHGEKKAAKQSLAQAQEDEEENDDKPKEDYSKPGTLPFDQLWGPEVKYSDQIANGDKDDDKEIQDEDDPRDPIVNDEGFVNQFKVNKGSVQEWNRGGVKKFRHKGLVQKQKQQNEEDADSESEAENSDAE